MTSGRMCAPEELNEKTEDASFERFESEGIVFHIQDDLLVPGTIEISISEEGGFTIEVCEE